MTDSNSKSGPASGDEQGEVRPALDVYSRYIYRTEYAGVRFAIPYNEWASPLPIRQGAPVNDLLLKVYFEGAAVHGQTPKDDRQDHIRITVSPNVRSNSFGADPPDRVLRQFTSVDEWQDVSTPGSSTVKKFVKPPGAPQAIQVHALLNLADRDPDGSIPVVRCVGECYSTVVYSTALKYSYQFPINYLDRWPVLHQALREYMASIIVE